MHKKIDRRADMCASPSVLSVIGETIYDCMHIGQTCVPLHASPPNRNPCSFITYCFSNFRFVLIRENLETCPANVTLVDENNEICMTSGFALPSHLKEAIPTEKIQIESCV